SCHAKDIILQPRLTTHLDEIRPGLGNLDYYAYLEGLSRFPGVPLMLEHLQTPQDYLDAADYVRGIARRMGLVIQAVG
ncbi:sugar phosphate isomerase/epimerase, partial [candidate division KSB1 bacterium]|nr:sugar phosphate isomerase/epimerase [candidate division KSB1 bacterium]